MFSQKYYLPSDALPSEPRLELGDDVCCLFPRSIPWRAGRWRPYLENLSGSLLESWSTPVSSAFSRARAKIARSSDDRAVLYCKNIYNYTTVTSTYILLILRALFWFHFALVSFCACVYFITVICSHFFLSLSFLRLLFYSVLWVRLFSSSSQI